MSTKRIILALTGASGQIYAQRLMHHLNGKARVSLVRSQQAASVWAHELPGCDVNPYGYTEYVPSNLSAPMASGSQPYHAMIICPCTMGTLAKVANGLATDLIARAADVSLKEGRKLILVVRESPLNLIHLENMKKAMQAGATIMPASPSFYTGAKTAEELADTIVHRIMDHIGLPLELPRWGGAEQ